MKLHADKPRMRVFGSVFIVFRAKDRRRAKLDSLDQSVALAANYQAVCFKFGSVFRVGLVAVAVAFFDAFGAAVNLT